MSCSLYTNWNGGKGVWSFQKNYNLFGSREQKSDTDTAFISEEVKESCKSKNIEFA